jgi:hypothetical protein
MSFEHKLSVDLERLAKDELFLNMLSSSINIDMLFERWLIQIRKALLLNTSKGNSSSVLNNLRVVLAIQNFMNEYVHSLDQEEVAYLDKLKITNEGDDVGYFTYAMYAKPEEFSIGQQEQPLSPLLHLVYEDAAEEIGLAV